MLIYSPQNRMFFWIWSGFFHQKPDPNATVVTGKFPTRAWLWEEVGAGMCQCRQHCYLMAHWEQQERTGIKKQIKGKGRHRQQPWILAAHAQEDVFRDMCCLWKGKYDLGFLWSAQVQHSNVVICPCHACREDTPGPNPLMVEHIHLISSLHLFITRQNRAISSYLLWKPTTLQSHQVIPALSPFSK